MWDEEEARVLPARFSFRTEHTSLKQYSGNCWLNTSETIEWISFFVVSFFNNCCKQIYSSGASLLTDGRHQSKISTGGFT